MEPLPGMSYAGGIQPPQRRSSQELIVTTGAGVVGTSAGVRRNNIATVSNTRKKLGFGDEEDFYNQMYLGGQGGQSTMFPGQQQQQPPQQQQQSQQPPSLQKDAVAHNLYTPPGPGPAAVGGMSSQNTMYSTGGLTGGMQSLSLHQQQQSATARPLGTANSQFVNRSSVTQTFPGMTSMTGMSQQLGGNNLSTSRGMMSLGSGGTFNRSLSSGPTLMSSKPAGRTSALSSAIGSALPMSSYGIGTRTQPMLNPLPTGFGSSGLPDPVGHSFDLSEFPVLGARSRPDSSSSLSSAMGIPGILPSRHGYGTAVQISKPVETTSEFQIQNEDFPALPGSKPPTTKPNAEASLEAPTENKFPLPPSSNNVLPEARPTTISYDLAPGANKEKLASATPIGPPKGAQKRTAQPVSIPANMVQDQFGMMGLLTFIRAAETDPGLVALALGSDLTTLGLNLNSPESLCSTFASPWADSPCRAQDIDYPVPQEYLIHPYIRDKLAPIQLKRYNEDLLFFLYYSNGGELLQLLATIELYNRDWRYHKEERVWITRAPGIEPTYKTTTYERGTYCYFDTTNWRRMNKEFHIEYDKLEDRPTLPSNVLNQTSHIPAQA
ncbi:CCR4-NOT transcription complex subunit 2-like [Dysidea avara]|uniref:CCR4-NOT transcription complex subunit 2-like n=1 Tax=Dysidea avara TaxID=196820 RepID=UPI0033209AC6